MKQYYLYMLASENNQALYTGRTNNLERRLYEHTHDLTSGFSKKYKCKKLVHCEVYNDPEAAIVREKDIKGWVRKRKNELIERRNPEWKDLSLDWQDPSAQALQDDRQNQTSNLQRYARQMALPGIGPAQQKKLREARICMVGAGGLGSAALPYLAGAGIGHITIIDHDTVAPENLHRQTIYKDSDTGQGKAEHAAKYLKELNPDITVKALSHKLTSPVILKGFSPEGSKDSESDPSTQAFQDDEAYDLLLDGSDNFETKTLLNRISVQTQTPLISASLLRHQATIGFFAGYAKDAPCYACLFPQLPTDALSCNAAGLLGTTAGIAGLYQAHMALNWLLGIGCAKPGTILTLDLESLRMQHLTLGKDPACPICKDGHATLRKDKSQMSDDIKVVKFQDLKDRDYFLIDVRSPEEVASEPVANAVNIPLPDLATRANEIPQDRLVALVCAAGIRSAKGAELLREYGYKDLCVLDRSSI